MLALLCLIAASQQTNICLFDTTEDICPQNSHNIQIKNFEDIYKITFDQTTLINFTLAKDITRDDGSFFVLDFQKLLSSIQEKIIIHIYGFIHSVLHISAKNDELQQKISYLYTSNMKIYFEPGNTTLLPDSLFENTELVAKSINAIQIKASISSFNDVELVISDKITLTANPLSVNFTNTPTLVSTMNDIVFDYENTIETKITLLIDKVFIIQNGNTISFRIKIVPINTYVNFQFKASLPITIESKIMNDLPILINAIGKCKLNFLNSHWGSKSIVIQRNNDLEVTLGNAQLSFIKDIGSLNLIASAPQATINSIELDNNIVEISSNDETEHSIIFESIESSNKILINSNNAKIFISIIQAICVNGATLTGNSIYQINSSPGSDFFYHVSNLQFPAEMHIPFVVGKITGSFEADKLVGKGWIILDYVGEPIFNQSDLDPYFQKSFNVVTVKSGPTPQYDLFIGVNEPIINGFSRGYSIYEPQYLQNNIVLKMTKKLEQVSSSFCIDLNNTEICETKYYPAHKLSSIQEIDQWSSFVDKDAKVLKFYCVTGTDTYSFDFQGYNFDKVVFKAKEMVPVSYKELNADNVRRFQFKRIKVNSQGKVTSNLQFYSSDAKSIATPNFHEVKCVEIDLETYQTIKDRKLLSETVMYYDFADPNIVIQENDVKVGDLSLARTKELTVESLSIGLQVSCDQSSTNLAPVSLLTSNALSGINVTSKWPENYDGLVFIGHTSNIMVSGNEIPFEMKNATEGILSSSTGDSLHMRHKYQLRSSLEIRNKNVVFEQFEMGQNANITGPFQINQLELTEDVEIPNLVIGNTLKIPQDRSFNAQELSFAQDNAAEIHIDFSLDKVPYVLLNIEGKNMPKAVHIHYVGSDASNLYDNDKEFYDRASITIFSTNANCTNWNIDIDSNYFQSHVKVVADQYYVELSPVHYEAPINSNPGLIIGCIVGACVIVIIIGMCLYYFVWKKQLANAHVQLGEGLMKQEQQTYT